MKRAYEAICAAEGLIAAVFLILMVVLIFLGGVMRMLGHPINWSGDAATALFAWACFLCADIAWRRNSLMSIEVVTSRLPERAALGLRMVNYALITAFLVYLIAMGILSVLDQPHPQLPGHSGDQLLVGDHEPAGRAMLLLSRPR